MNFEHQHRPELVEVAKDRLKEKPYCSARMFWVSTKSINGDICGSYKLVDLKFIENQSYICYEADYEPAFFLTNYIHVPPEINYTMYKELNINNRYNSVSLDDEKSVEILKRYGFLK
ncbi:hypothetical protein ZPAH1_orf00193 [Aeromonas phage ZPAH1]|nr:hypothetical protein ASwh1_144 [Aeromonas phage Aswh_1]QQG33955.1 hypothetical protein ZPAH1_orf00193 [Aeromonas phage ZPAH1]